jgi:hypothetical protein
MSSLYFGLPLVLFPIFEYLHYKSRREAMGKHRLHILEGDIVVLPCMLLPMLGLRNKNANTYNGDSKR